MSGSMTPRVQPGDVVLVSAVPGAQLRPGEVIAFRDPAMDRVLVHRIVAVLPGGDLRTKGDANAAPDSDPVPPASVLGLARLRVPAVALPLYWARTGRYGRLAVAGGVLVVLLAMASSAFVGLGARPRRPAHFASRPTASRPTASRPAASRPTGAGAASGRSAYPRQSWRHLAVRR